MTAQPPGELAEELVDVFMGVTHDEERNLNLSKKTDRDENRKEEEDILVLVVTCTDEKYKVDRDVDKRNTIRKINRRIPTALSS